MVTKTGKKTSKTDDTVEMTETARIKTTLKSKRAIRAKGSDIKKKQARQKLTARHKWRIILTIIFMVIFAGATVIVSQLVVGYLMLWILGAEILSQTIPMAIYSALSYALAAIIVIVVTLKIRQSYRHGSDSGEETNVTHLREELGLTDMPTWTDIGLAPIAFMVSLILAAGLLWLFNLFPWFNAEQAQSVGFSTGIFGIDRVIAFLVLVVIAPIFEEIIFRGWLYGEIRTRLSSVVPEYTGIVISSLIVSVLFGVVHLQWNVGVNVFALSIVLCTLREITGTIYAGILTHMIKNGVAFWLLYVIGM